MTTSTALPQVTPPPNSKPSIINETVIVIDAGTKKRSKNQKKNGEETPVFLKSK